MKSKIISILMILVIALTSLSAFAAEEATITAYNAGGSEITELESGLITFEATASGITTDISLIVVVYKNDEIVDFSVAEKVLPHSEAQTKLTAQVEIPSELSGCEAVAMLWDGLFTMNALCDEFVLD